MDRSILSLAVTFLVIALIAGFFGFFAAGSLAWGAKILFVIFLVLAVLACPGGTFFRRGRM